MTHPHDLLAEHVDGTLGDEDRAVVDAHLATCAACRDEVALARAARSALRELPHPVAPDEVGTRALAGGADPEASGTGGVAIEHRGAPTEPDHPRWYRWAGAAAGVAAVLLVVALVAPNLGNLGDDATMAADGAQEASGGLPPASQIEVFEGNLGPDDLAGLAQTARAAEAAGAPATDDAGTTPGSVSTTTEGVEDASTCLRTAFPALDGPPIRLLSATFQGTPAWIGIFREAPEGEQVPETLQVIAADRATCTILSTATARL